jgi:hypothetical protein
MKRRAILGKESLERMAMSLKDSLKNDGCFLARG